VKGPTASVARVAVVELGDRFGELRLCDAQELVAMRQSLDRYGQLQPVTAFRDQSQQLEVLDGLKRVRAARALGWPELWVSVADVGSVDAKVWLLELHQCHGLTELEEGWLVQSLHRDDGLSQGAIAQRLRRHKSWVCRRLLLVEGLETAVQADVRLGLLKPRAALAVGRLPRGNGRQAEAAGVVVRRGMTVRQTERMVADLVGADTAEDWSHRLRRWGDGMGASPTRSRVRPRPVRNEAEAISMDVATLRRVGARLEARLAARPLSALGLESAEIVRRALEELLTLLGILSRIIAAAIEAPTRTVQLETM
jgi:ParB-like chromosome segregation protein Spo0J